MVSRGIVTGVGDEAGDQKTLLSPVEREKESSVSVKPLSNLSCFGAMSGRGTAGVVLHSTASVIVGVVGPPVVY